MRTRLHAAEPAPRKKSAANAPHPHAMEARGGAQARAMTHDMAHEMGHGAGMDMQAMVRGMRNRFWISLVFTVPIFIYSPMGNMFTAPAPPFGLSLNMWLFFLASAAILYPVWPFVVAAVQRCATAFSTWRCWSYLVWARDICSAWAQPSSLKASSSTRQLLCSSSSFC